jgi:6-methylsalicylic acid synthase
LGGLGLEMARWMVDRGARRLILMVQTPLPPRHKWLRPPAASPYARAISAILEMEKQGVSLLTPALDIEASRQ